MKAVIQENERIPPKIHDLETLAQRAGMSDDALIAKLKVLSGYYIATRYPEDREALRRETVLETARQLIDTAEEALNWAKQMLQWEQS